MAEGPNSGPGLPDDCDGLPQPGPAHASSWPASVPAGGGPPSRAIGGGPPVYLLATWGQRAKAYLIDVAIVLVPLFALWALLLPGLVQRAADDPQLQADFDTIVDTNTEAFPIARLIYWTVVVLLAAIAIYWLVIGLYAAVFITRTAGQTPGTRLVGIRVMRADGKPITFGWALYRMLVVREVLFGIGAIVSLGTLQLAQYLWPLGDAERRTLHDMVARSRVVVDAEQQR